MKIKTDFITNSSSSAFVILKTSKYYNMLKNEESFHLKDGHDLGRSTGAYEGKDIMRFIWNEYHDRWIEPVTELINKYGLDNLAIIMISDEGMGGWLPNPRPEMYDEILFETEFH